jgi:C4-dicarboxylate-specific signal transduction histidine kinase
MHVELVTAWDLLKMMPTTGGITPGMMHELNQPLNAIKVGNDVIKMLVKKGDLQERQLKAVTHEIGKQIHRASLMIERFGKAGNLPGVEKHALQLNEPIQSTVDLLAHQLKLDNIDVAVELTEKLPLVMAHHNRLIQVIYNVMINAKEAIDTKRAADGKQEAHGIALRSFHNERWVYISISDTGTGLPEHMLDRVFEPFFTTKAKGRGKGLGLTICKQIVRDCKGRIEITSLKGGGTTVTLAFPMIREH